MHTHKNTITRKKKKLTLKVGHEHAFCDVRVS